MKKGQLKHKVDIRLDYINEQVYNYNVELDWKSECVRLRCINEQGYISNVKFDWKSECV